MKKKILTLFTCLLSFQSFAQFIIQAEGVHPENACAPSSIYFLTENKAKPIDRIDSINARLNRAVKIIKRYPFLESKPAIQLVVNCRSELGGGFHMVTTSGKDSLDTALLDFFKTVKKWKAGTLGNAPVDSWFMWRLNIKEGYIQIINP